MWMKVSYWLLIINCYNVFWVQNVIGVIDVGGAIWQVGMFVMKVHDFAMFGEFATTCMIMVCFVHLYHLVISYLEICFQDVVSIRLLIVSWDALLLVRISFICCRKNIERGNYNCWYCTFSLRLIMSNYAFCLWYSFEYSSIFLIMIINIFPRNVLFSWCFILNFNLYFCWIIRVADFIGILLGSFLILY